MACTCDPAISLATTPSSDKLRHHRSPFVGYLNLPFYTVHLFSSQVHDPPILSFPSFSAILDPLSVCLSHISHSTLYPFWFLASHTLPPSPHTHTPFTPLWICFSAFARHDLYRVLVLSWPGFAGCLFTTIPPSCNIHKHLLDLVTGLVSLCCLLLSFSWVGVMLALSLHHEFVYRLTCCPLGVVSNIFLICFPFIHIFDFAL